MYDKDKDGVPDKTDICPDIAGKPELILKDNPALTAHISSHIDSRGNDAYNMKLSQKRDRFVYEYLISKDIDPSRLSYIGYGESKLLNQCGNHVTCTKKQHAENRRTKFDIRIRPKK